MSWYARLILALQRRKYGAELEPARLWGRLPRALLSLTLLYRSIDRKRSPVEPGMRALVQVRVSQINGCAFCVDLNSAAALERLVPPEKLAALERFEASPLFTEREKAALAYAQAATDPRTPVDDACRARLRAHFDEQAIVELTALIAFQNMSSKFNAALGVPAQGFWLSNNWMYLALTACVVILLALFGRRGTGHEHGAGGCCGGMKHDKEGS